MAEIIGLDRAISAINRVDKRYFAGRIRSRAIVGFRAPYAIFVHENLEAFHPNGQAKFLEAPTRYMSLEVSKRMRQRLKEGATLSEALFDGGDVILEEAQRIVPVLTGFLHDSGFVEVT